jgi:hypothetical protein
MLVFRQCIGYPMPLPMVELLRYLEANGFVNYIASGGDRDFMRVVTDRQHEERLEERICRVATTGQSSRASGRAMKRASRRLVNSSKSMGRALSDPMLATCWSISWLPPDRRSNRSLRP